MDMETKDTTGNKYTCSFIIHKNEKGVKEERLIVKRENAFLTFKLINVNISPGG